MYVDNIYKYLYNFRRAVENAALKLKSELELGRVSNSTQM
jgi:hypothetical protein